MRVLGVAVIALVFNGCASRDAPTKSTSDAAVDTGATVESDSSDTPLDTNVPVDSSVVDTAPAPDTAALDAGDG